jgi:hypothetical protein
MIGSAVDQCRDRDNKRAAMARRPSGPRKLTPRQAREALKRVHEGRPFSLMEARGRLESPGVEASVK